MMSDWNPGNGGRWPPPTNDGTKTCNRCGVSKPLDQFPNHDSGRYGKRAQCFECWRPIHRSWNQVRKQRESSIRIHNSTRERLREVAKLNGMSMTDALNRILVFALEDMCARERCLRPVSVEGLCKRHYREYRHWVERRGYG